MNRAVATASHIAASVRSGSVSAKSALDDCLARIALTDGRVNAFTQLLAERARMRAAYVDAHPSRASLPLAGVPFAVKNLFDIAGLPTLAGSKIERDAEPARDDALLIGRLEAAGGILVGALNMDEYAYGYTTENSHYGPTRNPHDLARTAGGSSGGSAAAIAAGQVPLTLGSDTNGSIRVPASLCGCFGLKPTYGRLPRSGTFPFVASLDHLGPFAANVRDLALAYDWLQGPSSDDPACAARPVERVSETLLRGIADLRIGVLGGWWRTMADSDAHAAVSLVAGALGATREIILPEVERARAAAFLITNAESANLHLANLRTRPDDFEPLARDRFLAGALLPASWVQQAQRMRHWFARRVVETFADFDILLAPATPCVAPMLGTEWLELGGRRLPARPSLGLLAQPLSCIGLPVVTVPVWLPEDERPALPLGVQIIAAPWREDLAFRVAAALEAEPWCETKIAALT